MAPRRGIRGVTIDDVDAVASGGSKTLGGYTFTRGNRPLAGRSTPTVSAADLISGMTSGRINTAGQRYSGYPTAAALEQAVLGSTQPFYDYGEYARQLAEKENQKLLEEAASELRFGAGTAASRSLAGIRSALGGGTPESLAVKSAQERLADLLARNERYGAAYQGIAEANDLGNLPTPGQREEAILARRNLPEGSNFMQRAADELMARKALRDATYADTMAKRNAVAFAGTDLVEGINPITGEYETMVANVPRAPGEGIPLQTSRDVAISQALPGVQGAYESQFQQRVQPQLSLAEEIAATPRYELARQMATSYFNMDPALAAGMFTPQIDVDYMGMQADYEAALQRAAGNDPSATVEDILLREDPSGQRLAEYQLMQAEEAERKLYEGSRTAAEEEMDFNIEVATGYSVDQAAGDGLSLATARGRLSDPTFVATIDNAVNSLSGEQAETEADRKVIAQGYARQYLDQSADPVGAQILLNILLGYTFNIQPTFGM